MSDWASITEVKLYELIINSESEMSSKEQRYWEEFRVSPEKWVEKTYGNLGSGFWVVGIIGNKVIWYNDIEDGFNVSIYLKHGTIDEYSCNQDELHIVIKQLSYYLEHGY